MGRLRKCFCQVPRERFLRLCREKFAAGRSTVDLMKTCHSREDRDCVSAAALLGVEETFFRELLADDPASLEHVLGCRQTFRKLLAAEGIQVGHLSPPAK